ncbi:hypothetical protein FCV25MIE_22244 [Fagus crenata]
MEFDGEIHSAFSLPSDESFLHALVDQSPDEKNIVHCFDNDDDESCFLKLKKDEFLGFEYCPQPLVSSSSRVVNMERDLKVGQREIEKDSQENWFDELLVADLYQPRPLAHFLRNLVMSAIEEKDFMKDQLKLQGGEGNCLNKQSGVSLDDEEAWLDELLVSDLYQPRPLVDFLRNLRMRSEGKDHI